MRRVTVSFLLFLFLALLFALPAQAQLAPPTPTTPARTFNISGSLRNAETMRPMEMVRVDLRKFTGQTISTYFTRSNGEFEFVGLPVGIYLIVVEERDFEPIRENVEIINSSRNGVVLFVRRPLELAAARPGGTSVSSRELALPHKAQSAFEKGKERLYQKKDAEGSIAFFEKVLAEVPDFYEAYHQIGVARIKLDQPAPAEAAFRKSIDLSKGHFADPQFALASLLSNLGKFDEAESVARRGLEVDTNAWYGYYELGRAQLGLNRNDAAEKNLLEALSRQSTFAPLYLVLANLHIRRKEFPALLEDLKAFLKLEPSGPNSEHAKQMRDSVMKNMAQAQNAAPAAPPKP